MVPDDIVIDSFLSNRNQDMMQSTQCIYTKAVRQIQDLVKSKVGADASTGSIIKLKPFYIDQPTDREKESCLCIFCRNLQLKFNALQSHLKDRSKFSV